ncbi:MAG: biotin transporter BioY [Bacillota bacterium]|nr:biotin transporter BioY [Bacillota bacterium]
MKKFNIKNMALCAMFAALSAVSAFIKIPSPIVPFTMQVFVVVLSGVLLGSRLGAISQALYVAIGLIGLPVFTTGGGLGYVFQPSFGYLFGFICGSFVAGFITERIKKPSFLGYFLALIITIIAVYIPGVIHLYIIKNLYLGTSMSIGKTLWYGAALFIPEDLITGIIAILIALRIRPVINNL